MILKLSENLLKEKLLGFWEKKKADKFNLVPSSIYVRKKNGSFCRGYIKPERTQGLFLKSLLYISIYIAAKNILAQSSLQAVLDSKLGLNHLQNEALIGFHFILIEKGRDR